MYAYKDNGVWVLSNLVSRFKGVGGFHLLSDQQRKSHGFYPCTVVGENYNPRLQNRSDFPDFKYDSDNQTVTATYVVNGKSDIVLLDEFKTRIKNQAEILINETVSSLGYDDANSIAKYLVVGNPFYEECFKLSMWISSVWLYLYDLETNESPVDFLQREDSIVANLPKFKDF